MIAINRPEKRNAVDPATAVKLFEAIKDFESDTESTAAVLHGKGTKAFLLPNNSAAYLHGTIIPIDTYVKVSYCVVCIPLATVLRWSFLLGI